VAHLRRNQWPTWLGIGGPLGSESVAHIGRNPQLADGFPEKAHGALCFHNVEITRPKNAGGEKLAIGFSGYVVYRTEAGPEHAFELRSGTAWWCSPGQGFMKGPMVTGIHVLETGTLAFALTKDEYEALLQWRTYVAIRLRVFDVRSGWEQSVGVQLPSDPPRLPQPKLPF